MRVEVVDDEAVQRIRGWGDTASIRSRLGHLQIERSTYRDPQLLYTIVRHDLVFYYDRIGYVHHVGIYLSPGMSIAAMSPELGVGYQPVAQTPSWDGSGVSYGSFTHT